MTYLKQGQVGDWIFWAYPDHGFKDHGDRPLYGFTGNTVDDANQPKIGELYESIEHAMAAAVAEKFTGKRGAGGTGVGTAADWFMKMIGAYEVKPVDRPDQELTDAMAATDSYRGPLYGRSGKMADWLAARGLTIAKRVNGG